MCSFVCIIDVFKGSFMGLDTVTEEYNGNLLMEMETFGY